MKQTRTLVRAKINEEIKHDGPNRFVPGCDYGLNFKLGKLLFCRFFVFTATKNASRVSQSRKSLETLQ